MLKDNEKNPSAENRANGNVKNQKQNQNKEGAQKAPQKNYSERA